MSKFVEKIKRIQKNSLRPLGFRKPVADELPLMLIVSDITGASAKKIKELCNAEVDALVISSNGMDSQLFEKLIKNVSSSIPTGLMLEDGHMAPLASYIDMGCDFAVFDLNAGVELMSNDNLGKILKVDQAMPAALIKPINDIDSVVDGVLLQNKNKFIDVNLILNLKLFSSLLNKPLLAEANGKTSEADLAALNRVGVKAIVLDSSMSSEEVKQLQIYIKTLPRTFDKASLRPLIPGISIASESKQEEEEEDDEEEI